MCTRPATPSSIEASAPCLLYLIITPFTSCPFLYFSAAVFQGFSLRALIEREIFPSLISITFTRTCSPTVKNERGSSTSPQSSSLMCTSPSRPCSSFTNTPKSTAPVTSPDTSSPTWYLSIRFAFSASSSPARSVKISLPSLGSAVMIRTGRVVPTSFRSSPKILSLSPSGTRG